MNVAVASAMRGGTLLTVTVLVLVSLPPSPSLRLRLMVTSSTAPLGSSDQAHLNVPVLAERTSLMALPVPLVPLLTLAVQESARGAVQLFPSRRSSDLGL